MTRLSPDEHRRLELAAKRNHQPLSTFLRESAELAAADLLDAAEARPDPRRPRR
jgi:uncharacterized protein (DUF1778 family)